MSKSEDFRLAKLLLEKILINNPKAKTPDIKKWAADIEKLIRIDKHPPDIIEAVIEWCQVDTFWMCNILSAEKLRKQFDQLYLKMNADGVKGSPGQANRQQAEPGKYDNIPTTEICIDE